MSELETRFRISLDGTDQVANALSKNERDVKGWRSRVGAAFKSLGDDVKNYAAVAARGLMAIAGAGAGFGFAAQAKGALELRDQITGLAAAAGMADGEIAGLRERILGVTTATNQFGKDAVDALQAFVAKTGDIKAGADNLELFGRVATATRAEMSEIANIGADLSKLKITDQRTAFAVLAKQADVGAVELKDLVSQGPRLLSAFMGAGLEGERGLRRGGALAQVFQMGTGNVERTSTAVEATFRDIATKANVIEQGLGVKVRGRDRTEVLEEIIRKTKGDEFVLRKIFGDEAYRGVNIMASEFRKTGGFATFDKFANVQADGALIDRKFQLNTSTGLAAVKRAEILAAAKTQRELGGGLENVARTGSGVLSRVYDFAVDHPGAAGGTVLAAMFAKRLLFPGKGGGGGGLKGLIGGAAGAAGGAIPVTVTNWPASLGGAADAAGDALAAGGKGGRLGKIMRGLGTGIAGFGFGYSLGTAADEAFGISDSASEMMHEATGGGARDRAAIASGVAKNRGQLAAREQRRQARIADLMARGLDRGHAINLATREVEGGGVGSAFDPRAFAEALKALPLNFTINVGPDGAVSVEAPTGARAPKVKARRTVEAP